MKKNIIIISVSAILCIVAVVLIIVYVTKPPENEIINIVMDGYLTTEDIVLGEAKASSSSSDPIHFYYYFKDENEYDTFINNNLKDSPNLINNYRADYGDIYILGYNGISYLAICSNKMISTQPLVTYLSYGDIYFDAPLFINDLDISEDTNNNYISFEDQEYSRLACDYVTYESYKELFGQYYSGFFSSDDIAQKIYIKIFYETHKDSDGIWVEDRIWSEEPILCLDFSDGNGIRVSIDPTKI